MKKNLTEMVFILDRSGSMSGLESDTIGGFNAMLARQRREEGEALVSTVMFSTESQVIHDRADVKTVRDLTLKDYVPGGCTALMDAVGDAIRHISLVHKYAREEDRPARTVFVITTDGLENASHRYTLAQVRGLIEKKQAEGWEFLFLGANIDAAATAGSMGIAQERAVNFHADACGMQANFESVNEAVSMARRSAPIKDSWKACAEADFQRRR